EPRSRTAARSPSMAAARSVREEGRLAEATAAAASRSSPVGATAGRGGQASRAEGARGPSVGSTAAPVAAGLVSEGSWGGSNPVSMKSRTSSPDERAISGRLAAGGGGVSSSPASVARFCPGSVGGANSAIGSKSSKRSSTCEREPSAGEPASAGDSSPSVAPGSAKGSTPRAKPGSEPDAGSSGDESGTAFPLALASGRGTDTSALQEGQVGANASSSAPQWGQNSAMGASRLPCEPSFGSRLVSKICEFSFLGSRRCACDRAVIRTIVMKFGGTSVSTAESWATIDSVVRARQAEGLRPVLVCSAMAGISNRLETLVDSARDGSHEPFLASILEEHRRLGQALGVDADAILAGEFETLERIALGIHLIGDASPRVRAQVMALGELMSTRLGAAWLASRGLDVHWVDARTLLRSDGRHLGNEAR